ncbi:hypothetical protein MUK42_34497 [Musa troglodytarum]|uniref:Uncharacterized protein n=1 Tax=Musa troglodytarum TaxID=320322 RepID=A0A9E7FF66_9LILI|nr:hypothetical protein MUK42_34497 [Musa troglodytarum]
MLKPTSGHSSLCGSRHVFLDDASGHVFLTKSSPTQSRVRVFLDDASSHVFLTPQAALHDSRPSNSHSPPICSDETSLLMQLNVDSDLSAHATDFIRSARQTKIVLICSCKADNGQKMTF